MSSVDPGQYHTPVMLDEVLSGLITDRDGFYVDGTLGMGGHTRAILAKLSPKGRVLGVDLDPVAFGITSRLQAELGDRAILRNASYADLPTLLPEFNVSGVQGILLDLGLSSFTLQQSGRGFTFQGDEPLDMRFNPDQGKSLADLLATWSEKKIVEILQIYGEERRARGIGAHIYSHVLAGNMQTNADLAAAVGEVAKGPERTKTLARVFQAFRIEVNNELQILETFLTKIPTLLKVGGRAAIISFHSLEDRIVKRFVAHESRDCVCPPEILICECGHVATVKAINRKPLIPSDDEMRENPRSRSAKLRVMERIA